jgi:hypothetical protein
MGCRESHIVQTIVSPMASHAGRALPKKLSGTHFCYRMRKPFMLSGKLTSAVIPPYKLHVTFKSEHSCYYNRKVN